MNKQQDKAVIFDLGNVLLSFDFNIAAGKLAQQSDKSPSEIRTLIDQSSVLHTFEKGQMSQESFYKSISESSGYQGSLEEFRQDFSDIFAAIQPMIDFMRELKQQGITTGVFSNTNEMAADFIRARYTFFSEFDHYCLSYEHGAMKPEESLYRLVEKMSSRKGDQLFFIDDRAENVEAAIDLGWSGQVHSDPEQTISKVKAWLG